MSPPPERPSRRLPDRARDAALRTLHRTGWRVAARVPTPLVRALAALAHAAGRIGEVEEQVRCTEFLRASSAQAARELGL